MKTKRMHVQFYFLVLFGPSLQVKYSDFRPVNKHGRGDQIKPTVDVDGSLQCAYYCHTTPDCDGFRYRSDTGICKLYSNFIDYNDATEGWNNAAIHTFTPLTTCGPGWIRIRNSCYLPSTSETDWNTAKSVCEQSNATLVIRTDGSDASSLMLMWNKIFHTQNLFLGAVRYANSNQWQWYSGGEKWSLGNWASGEPDLPQSETAYLALMFDTSKKIYFIDVPYNSLLNYFCVKKAPW